MLNVTGALAVIPKAFHQPIIDPYGETCVSRSGMSTKTRSAAGPAGVAASGRRRPMTRYRDTAWSTGPVACQTCVKRPAAE